MHVDAVARDQYGLVTRQQARSSGLSERQIDYRLSTDAWQRVHTGVYRLRSAPTNWEGQLLAATLATGGVASHLCSAALWELDVFYQPDLHISIPSGQWQSLDGVKVYRSTQWGHRDESRRRGIPTTGVNRTILDSAGVLRLTTVERLAEAAIRKKLTTWLSLAECLSNHSIQGRNGCLTLRRLLQIRLEDRTVPLSDFSRRVVNLLVENGVPRPTVEYRIYDDDGGFIMQTDLAWPERKKAWELDGLQWHFGRSDVERDRRKRNRAKAVGWNIQEILWSMYVDSPEELVRMAHRFLR